MQPIHAAVLCGNSGVVVTQFQMDFVMNFSVLMDGLGKNWYLFVSRNLQFLFSFWDVIFLAKLSDFFWCLLAFLGVNSGKKKKVSIAYEWGSKKFQSFIVKVFVTQILRKSIWFYWFFLVKIVLNWLCRTKDGLTIQTTIDHCYLGIMGPFLRPYVIEQRLKNFCPMNSAEEISPSYE